MSIISQNAIINQYSPAFCVNTPEEGEVFIYDSIMKTWRNKVIEAADLGGIAPSGLIWENTYNPGDVVTISDDLQSFVSVPKSEFGGPGGGASRLNDLSDVSIIAPILDSHVLSYDTTTDRWTNITLSYDNLLNVPTDFPPSPHTHTETDITDLDKYTQLEVNLLLSGKADAGDIPQNGEFSFIGLLDTPSSYAGSDGDILTVVGNTVQFMSPGEFIAVDSVYGRTGDVVAMTGDYNSTQVSNSSSVPGSSVSNALEYLNTSKGETNDAVNLGAGVGVFANKNGDTLQFKSLIAGANITMTTNSDTITINGASQGIEEAPNNGRPYGRQDSAWVDVATATQGSLADTATQPGDNISLFTNDAGYITLAEIPTSVTSVFGRTGEIVAQEGDYNISQMGDVLAPNPLPDDVLVWNGSNWVAQAVTVSGVTSGQNVGAGTGQVFDEIVGNTMQFRTLTGGTNVTINTTGDEIIINATSSGGGGLSDAFTSVGSESGTINATGPDNFNIVGQGSQIDTSVSGSNLIISWSANLADLSNVTAFSPVNGQYLGWNGASWASKTISINEVANLQTELDNTATSEQGDLADTALQNLFNESIGDLIDVDITGITNGQILFWDTDKFIVGDPAGGSTSFLGLTDTPPSYVGQSGNTLRVKTDESGLEFFTPTAPVTSVDGRTGVVTLGDLYATSAQGDLADTAVQPGDNISSLNNDAGYITSAESGIQAVVEDLNPRLGGNLDVNNFDITGGTGINVFSLDIDIRSPSGSGNVRLGRPDGLDTLWLNGSIFPTSRGISGQVLTTNGAGSLSWTTASAGGATQLSELTDVSNTLAPTVGHALTFTGTFWESVAIPESGLQNIVEDTSPQLGGDLDVNGNDINGDVTLNGIRYPIIDGTAGQVLSTDGNGDLTFVDMSSGSQTLLGLTDTAASAVNNGILRWNSSGTEVQYVSGLDWNVLTGTVVNGSAQAEQIQDQAARLITTGTHQGISVAYSDASNQLNFTNTDSGSNQNIFKTIVVGGQPAVTANSNSTNLALIAGTDIILTTDNSNKSITISSTASGLQSGDNVSELVNDAGYITSAGAGLQNVVEDITPQLGGDLDANGFTILDATASDLKIGSDIEFRDSGTLASGIQYVGSAFTELYSVDNLLLSGRGAGIVSITTENGDVDVLANGGDINLTPSGNLNIASAYNLTTTPGTNGQVITYNNGNAIWADQTGSGGGEANTASNLGAGEGIFAQKSSVDLQFKSLVAGTGITLSSDGVSITVNSTGGGGGIEEAPIDGKQYARQDASWTEVQSGGGGSSTFESIRVNYNAFGTITNVQDASAGITSATVESSQWISFEFDANRPPTGITYYGYKDLGANGFGYKMVLPSDISKTNEVLTGGSAGSPAELLTNMVTGKIRLQARTQETLADNGEHAFIFFLF